MFGDCQDFGKLPHLRMFVQDYIFTLYSKNESAADVQEFVNRSVCLSVYLIIHYSMMYPCQSVNLSVCLFAYFTFVCALIFLLYCRLPVCIVQELQFCLLSVLQFVCMSTCQSISMTGCTLWLFTIIISV